MGGRQETLMRPTAAAFFAVAACSRIPLFYWRRGYQQTPRLPKTLCVQALLPAATHEVSGVVWTRSNYLVEPRLPSRTFCVRERCATSATGLSLCCSRSICLLLG